MSIADEIQKLHELRNNGALNEGEFVRAKAIVLGHVAAPDPVLSLAEPSSDWKHWLRNFSRSPKDRWLGGICGGLGEQTPVPSWGWRILFSLSIIFYGIGLIPYFLMWLFIPETSNTAHTALESGQS